MSMFCPIVSILSFFHRYGLSVCVVGLLDASTVKMLLAMLLIAVGRCLRRTAK